MDNLGSEVSQKMRSAVKAKLIELGTGGSAGYIDDELPDYVMIMVANKRSKQQMMSDLNLFLGSQTELFVIWLHEVLQKLQEVTLPTAAAPQKNKRKGSEKEDLIANKRDKKDKKKDKKSKKSTEETADKHISSITDVVAGQLLEKAKQSLIATNSAIKFSKKESTPPSSLTDDFDIPTITEISSDQNQPVVSQKSREKDLAELAEIQKKIYEAKKHLKNFDEEESEDEDFLSIKEDAEEFDDDVSKQRKAAAVAAARAKSPIVFNKDEEKNDNEREVRHRSPIERTQLRSGVQGRHEAISFNRRPREFPQKRPNPDSQPEEARWEPKMQEISPKKRSIHDRLGVKTKSSDAPHRRVEKELYVPAFRRKEMEMEQRSRNREMRDRSLDADRARDYPIVRQQSPEKSKRDASIEVVNRRRIGSRVIVAPPKPEVPSDDDDEKMVNSVIKIKPRPAVSPSKQASKNLLLRAVAEAQRSTVLAKPIKELLRRRSPSPLIPSSRNQKLYTKSYRDRLNRDALVRRLPKDNIVVEVKGSKRIEINSDMEEDEYVPERISDRGESDTDLIYIPQQIHSVNVDEDDENEDYENEIEEVQTAKVKANTQFVVTLDDKSGKKYKSRLSTREAYKNGVETKKPLSREKSNSHSSSRTKTPERNHKSPKASSTRSPASSVVVPKKLIENYRKPKDMKKFIIQNDSDDDDVSPQKDREAAKKVNKQSDSDVEDGSMTPPLPVAKLNSKSPVKRKRSPIKFDLSEQQSEPKRRSKSADQEKTKSPKGRNSSFGEEGGTNNNENRILTKKCDVVKKYDNIPELLSSVPIDSSVIKVKTKERCKFYPSCQKVDCEFYHPLTQCKAFPNCKFAEKCLYIHPKCKFDLTCNKIACNFSHSVSMTGQPTAPPLSSHVVPVQNYKSITATPLPAMCKFYPNCTNTHCTFFHPKLCRFGKNCINKLECNFYHQDVASKDKFKWVATVV